MRGEFPSDDGHEDISSNIEHAACRVALEAFRRDNCADVFQCPAQSLSVPALQTALPEYRLTSPLA